MTMYQKVVSAIHNAKNDGYFVKHITLTKKSMEKLTDDVVSSTSVPEGGSIKKIGAITVVEGDEDKLVTEAGKEYKL